VIHILIHGGNCWIYTIHFWHWLFWQVNNETLSFCSPQWNFVKFTVVRIVLMTSEVYQFQKNNRMIKINAVYGFLLINLIVVVIKLSVTFTNLSIFQVVAILASLLSICCQVSYLWRIIQAWFCNLMIMYRWSVCAISRAVFSQFVMWCWGCRFDH
jgi:hypothetical protein